VFVGPLVLPFVSYTGCDFSKATSPILMKFVTDVYVSQAPHASRKVLDFLLKIPGPGKSCKLKLKVMGSRGKYP